MKYAVEVHFRKPPCWSESSVIANSSEEAKAAAVRNAKRCGFTDRVKKVSVRKVQS